MYNIIPVGAAPGSEAFLLITPQKTALFDSGFAYCAGELIKNIERALSGRTLDYIILSHTHYDHCSGAAYCLERWPDVKIIAGTYSARVFSRPGALRTIRSMNESAAIERGHELQNPGLLEKLRVDIPVAEGDTIDLGDLTFRVIESPGHTWCSISMYCETEQLLIVSESQGMYGGQQGFVIPGFMVGYAVSVESVKKVMDLPVKTIMFPHMGPRTSPEIDGFFESALTCFEETKNAVLDAYRAGKRDEDLLRVLTDRFFSAEAAQYQPKRAFLLNSSYMIPMLVRECLGVEDFDMSHDVDSYNI